MIWTVDYNHKPRPTPKGGVLNTVQECEAMCEHTMALLKKQKNMRMRMKQMSLLHDCADICGLTAKYMARRSPFSQQMALLCAEVCTACGNECTKLPDAESRECGEMCLKCARECRDYAGEKS